LSAGPDRAAAVAVLSSLDDLCRLLTVMECDNCGAIEPVSDAVASGEPAPLCTCSPAMPKRMVSRPAVVVIGRQLGRLLDLVAELPTD